MQKASKFLLLYAVFYFLFLYAPIFLLPIFAFNDSAIISLPLSGITFDWFFLLWETEALHDALYNSVLIASIAAILSTIWVYSPPEQRQDIVFRAKKA